MASATTVRRLVEEGLDYHAVADRLGITPGLAYLLATGLPADGSDAPGPGAHERPGFLPSSQRLANPVRVVNPTAKQSVLDWMRKRVEGDEPMRRAASQRDAGPADRQPGDEAADLVDELTRDHNRVNSLLKQLKSIPGASKGGSPAQQSARESIAALVTVELSRHEAAEEDTLWPLVRRTLPEGEQRAEEAERQEQRGKDLLNALDGFSGHDEEFDDLVKQLNEAVHIHVAFEEKVFLELRDRLDRDELLQHGRRYVEARATAPAPPEPAARRRGKPTTEAVSTTVADDDQRTEN